MRFINYKNLKESQGNFMLIYSPSGGGKSATSIQTSRHPIRYITSEGRKIETTISAINRPNLRMGVGIYENFEDLIDMFMTAISREKAGEKSQFTGTKTIIKDSLTHLMLVHLSQEILQENYESKTDKEREELLKALTMRVKVSQEAYGAMAGNMNRLMRALQGMTMLGYDVICIARMSERPKWDRALSAAPALMGQEFAKSMDGFFDFIGFLEEYIPSDNLQIPKLGSSTFDTWKYCAPIASFNSNSSYLAKWTGAMPSKGIKGRKFHVQRTFDEANGIFRPIEEYFSNKEDIKEDE